MRNPILRVLLLLLLPVVAVIGGCQRPGQDRPVDPLHGRYLVERVGLCIDCHSPRDQQGKFVADAWLTGAPIPFTPAVAMPWANAAPRIAGLPSLTDEQAVHFLTTGELPGGRTPRAPMPPYRMTRDDARDVVAYLRKPIPPVLAQ